MTAEPNGQTRRSLLRRGSLLGAGTLAAGVGLLSAGRTPAAAASGWGAAGTTETLAGASTLKSARVNSGVQNQWRYCAKCKGLYYGGAGNGVCPRGGGHDPSLSGDYWLFHDFEPDDYSQNGWRWCRKCQGLAFGAVAGACPTGGGHDYTGSFDYAPWTTFTISDQQRGWAHCLNCQGMHYAPVISQSRCPRTGGNHITVGSFEYWLDLR